MGQSASAESQAPPAVPSRRVLTSSRILSSLRASASDVKFLGDLKDAIVAEVASKLRSLLEGSADERRAVLALAVADTMRASSPEILKILVEEHQALEGWSLYQEEMQVMLAHALAKQGIQAAVYEKWQEQQESYEKCEILLKAGFNRLTDEEGCCIWSNDLFFSISSHRYLESFACSVATAAR
jgi:hypothetical protein